MAEVFGIVAGASWHKAQAMLRVAECRSRARESFKQALRAGVAPPTIVTFARKFRSLQLGMMAIDLAGRRVRSAAPPPSPAAPAPPAKPAKPKESLLLARPLPYVLEGIAAPFNEFGGPRLTHTGQVIATSIRSGVFDHQIDRGRVVLAVNHDYSGDPDDALEVLAAQADGTLRLFTADNRLHFLARLRDTKLGREIVAKAKANEITGMSIGYIQNQRSLRGAAECTLDGELTEISVLTGRLQPRSPGTSCRVLYAPVGLSIHHPEFRALASDTAIGAARRQLRVCRG